MEVTTLAHPTARKLYSAIFPYDSVSSQGFIPQQAMGYLTKIKIALVHPAASDWLCSHPSSGYKGIIPNHIF